MPNWKIVISDPQAVKSYQTEVEQDNGISLMGKKINDEFDGSLFGLNNYTLKITGGTDKDGFPMHPSVQGQGKKKVLLTEPPGFHPKLKGQRRRKTVRGNTISQVIAQINVKVVKKGEKGLEEIFGKKEESKAETKEEEKQAPKEEKKQEETPKEQPKETPKEEKREQPKAEPEQKPETGGVESKEAASQS